MESTFEAYDEAAKGGYSSGVTAGHLLIGGMVVLCVDA